MDFSIKRTPRQNHSHIYVKLKRGLNVDGSPPLDGDITDQLQISTVGLLGGDFSGSRLELLVDQGSVVRAGDPVMRDRRRPDIIFTAPAGGTVNSVARGARRSLVSLSITRDSAQPPAKFDLPDALSQAAVRKLLTQSGLWSCLRSRPFGHIPDPADDASALLITAIDTRPLAPDPATIIMAYPEQFALGVNAISKIINGPVYLCKSSNSELSTNLGNINIAEFDGPHPAGLAGTHIHVLSPIGFTDKQVWHIGYQDVISLGHLLQCGSPWFERVVALAGPAIQQPRLIKVPLGASTDEIVRGQTTSESTTIISGSVLDGNIAAGDTAFLGQRSNQILVLNENLPGFAETSPGNDPLIATTDLDQAAPPGMLATPFLRALCVGDVDRIRQLGGLEFVEEDLGLLSHTSSTGIDYGPLLRTTLEQLHQELSDGGRG